MKDIILISGVLICAILLIVLTLSNLVFVIRMKKVDRLAESCEDSLKRYENNFFRKLFHAIAGALFGPESHSINRNNEADHDRR